MAALAAGLPSELEGASFDFSHCDQISKAGVAAFRGSLPAKLLRLSLSLGGTQVSQEVQEQCLSLEGLRQCTELDVPGATETAQAEGTTGESRRQSLLAKGKKGKATKSKSKKSKT
ncbi:unnamed protein product [Polarella glacialis]|uniref:Uncharacterized protein n=1 Tax=Polarella glacialis TaxID=89957 RepID=A0A813FG03_POLGL|nr:unnamed protein product [Polarella glacialis]CAE8661244.1 unnamed protein product [Polarella glacialis]